MKRSKIRTFVSRLSEEGILYMDKTVNEFLDALFVEDKTVLTVKPSAGNEMYIVTIIYLD